MISIFNGAGDLTTDAPSTNGTSITLTKPVNIADGDLLIAEVTFQNANGIPSITPPTGWTRLGPAVSVSPLRPSGIYVLPVPSAAAIADTSWTWTTNVSTGRRRGMLFRATGVDLTTPQDAYGSWSAATGTSSIVLPEVTVVTSNSVLLTIAYTQSAAGTGYPSFTPPSPMVTIATVNTTPDSLANTGLWAGYESVGTGASGTRTVTLSPTVSNSGGYMVALRSADGIPAPILVHNIAGAVTPTGFVVAFKASNVASGVRAVVSTSSSLVSPTYFGPVVPDGDDYGRISVTSLNNDTIYYWGLEVDGVLSQDYHGTTRTLPADGAQSSFSFVAASCVNTGDNPTTFDNMRTRVGAAGQPARFFGHLGDFHYVYSTGGGTPVAPTDQAILRENYTNQIAQSRQHQLFREIPLSYTWSDVDSFGSNGDGTYAANPYANAAYRQVFPLPADLPATTGIYRSWTIGRVLFIQTDQRTFASSRSATDDSLKTKLGSTQKAWFTNLAQTTTAKLIVWLGDGAWFGAASVSGTNDSWSAYNTERTEIGNIIAASGKNLIYIHGDVHALAADSGVNNQWGGFPIVCAAPMSRPDMNPWPTTSGWTVSNGSYPSATQAGTAYGWFDVADTGNYITLDFSGYNAEIEQVSMQVTWFAGRFQKGNGTNLVPYVKIGGSLTEIQ